MLKHSKSLAKSLLAGSVLLTGVALSQAAYAADAIDDIPTAPEPAVVDEYRWGGGYAGGSLGYQWSGSDISSAGVGIATPETDGFIGGGFAGYNYEFDNIVLGVEGNIDILDGQAGFGTPVGPGEIEYDWMVTLGPRVGYALEEALVFVEGGYAATQSTVSAGGVSDDNYHNGYFVGAGADVAITNNIFAGVKYNYVAFDDQNFTGGGITTTSSDTDFHIVKARVGFKF